MTDPANGMVMASCILILGCIGLSTVAYALHLRKQRSLSAVVAENAEPG